MNPRKLSRRFLTAFSALLLAVLCCSVADACPNCSNGLAEQSDGGDLVAGYFWSILFMMGMPFLLLTSFSGYMYLEVRRARAKRDEPGDVASDAKHGDRERHETR